LIPLVKFQLKFDRYYSAFSDLKIAYVCATILSAGETMKPTQLLKYLIDKMKENGIIDYNKDFLDYLGVETNLKHTKKLSDYLRRSGSIRDMSFLKAIENKFGLHPSIWKVCESSQVQRVNESIQKALVLQKLPNKDALDISDIIQSEHVISECQQQKLAHFKTLNTQESFEHTIDTFLVQGLLEKKIENQEFLIALLYIAYDKGLYAIIITFILPQLYANHRQRTQVQKVEAHAKGSLDEYTEAKCILHSLMHENIIENINLRTSALSNHKRELFSSIAPIKKESLYLLIQGYQELHAIEGIYSYYTGINLLYMVVLGQILFLNDDKFNSIDTNKIYKLSKPSLTKDKTHNDYYVRMSELEFHLLLGREGILQKIESFLGNQKPHPSLVERTLRQMKIFSKQIENSQHTLVPMFKKTVALLKDYIITKKI
jgi:hypothetical protein